MPFATTKACSCTSDGESPTRNRTVRTSAAAVAELRLFGREHGHLLGLFAQQAQMAFGEASETEIGT